METTTDSTAFSASKTHATVRSFLFGRRRRRQQGSAPATAITSTRETPLLDPSASSGTRGYQTTSTSMSADSGSGGAASTSFETDEGDAIYRARDDDSTTMTAKTTEVQSFLHLLKGYVGPGCLSLPWAFSQLGAVTGTLSCFALAFWSSYNCWSVVKLKRQLVQQRQSVTREQQEEQQLYEDAVATITYPDVSEWLYGRKMRRFTTLCICVQQLAICTVFFSFVGTNLQAVLASTFGLQDISHVAVISMCLPAVMGLVFLPNLKALAPVTATATLLLFVGLLLLAVVVILEWPNRPRDVATPVDWRQVPLALCAILYSYEGICLILPVESAMQRPTRFFGVFSAAMTSSASIFALVAVSSILAFGQVTNGSVTAFLLEKYANNGNLRSWLLAANAAVSLSVLLTYPLQLFPALELLGPLLSRRRGTVQGSNRRMRWPTAGLGEFQSIPEADMPGNDSATVGRDRLSVEIGSGGRDHEPEQPNGCSSLDGASDIDDLEEEEELDGIGTDDTAHSSPKTRIALVLLTYVIAVAVPNVQVLISLAGAVAGSSTALLIPPSLELAWLRRTTQTDWKVSKCYGLLVGGAIFLGIGTFAALADIVRVYSGKDR